MTRLAAGIDFGRHGDETASCVLDYSNPEIWLIDTILTVKAAPWPLILRLVNSQVQDCRPILGDATGRGDSLVEFIPNCIGIVWTGQGSAVRKLTFGRLSVPKVELFKPLFNRLSAFGIRANADIPGLQDQLTRFAIGFSRQGKVKYQAASGHDDMIAALALACYGAHYCERIEDHAKEKAA